MCVTLALRVRVVDGTCGELHLYEESALGAGVGGDCGVMGVGDCLDDGESEAVTVGVARTGRIETLERLEESGKLRHWDLGAVVDDRQDRMAMRGAGGDVDAAAGMVVADCVVDEVGHEAFGEARGDRGP